MRGRRAIDVSATRRAISDLIATGIFCEAEAPGPLFRAAFMWLIINLHELIQSLNNLGLEIEMADDDGYIVELIGRARYQLVHAGAGYGVQREGSGTNRILVGPASGYADDIAVEMGGVRIMVFRHAVHAFEAACAACDARRIDG